MVRSFRPLILLALLAVVASCNSRAPESPTAVGPPEGGPTYWPRDPDLIMPNEDQYVTQLDEGVDPYDVASDLGLEVVFVEDFDGTPVVLFEGSPLFNIDELRSADGVDFADPNGEVRLSEHQSLVIGFYEGEWTADTLSADIGLISLSLKECHDYATGQGVKIAVLDTGADLQHPYLENNLEVLGPNERLGSEEFPNELDDDDDGVVDEAYGHGTHVAGTVLQVAPAAIVLPIRVLTAEGIGSFWDLVVGLILAAKHDCDVINLSLSLSDEVDLFNAMLRDLDVDGKAVPCAAGNYGWRNSVYPATFETTVGVAAVDYRDDLAQFSGAGPEISTAGPGVAILSAYPDRSLAWATGTSMATPTVSGSIALIMEWTGLSADDAAGMLMGSTVPIKPSTAIPTGRVNPLSILMVNGS